MSKSIVVCTLVSLFPFAGIASEAAHPPSSPVITRTVKCQSAGTVVSDFVCKVPIDSPHPGNDCAAPASAQRCEVTMRFERDGPAGPGRCDTAVYIRKIPSDKADPLAVFLQEPADGSGKPSVIGLGSWIFAGSNTYRCSVDGGPI